MMMKNIFFSKNVFLVLFFSLVFRNWCTCSSYFDFEIEDIIFIDSYGGKNIHHVAYIQIKGR